jgi:hypothetical protein
MDRKRRARQKSNRSGRGVIGGFSLPNQTDGCAIFAFCAKVGSDTAKATPAQRNNPAIPSIVKQTLLSARSEITLSSRPKRSAAEGPCVRHDRRRLTCRAYSILGRARLQFINPRALAPEGRAYGPEKTSVPEIESQRTPRHRWFFPPKPNRGCPIFAFCAKVGAETVNATA